MLDSTFESLMNKISSGASDDDLIALIDRASKEVLSQKQKGGGFEYSILTQLLIFGNKKAFWHLEKTVGLELLCESPLLGAMENPIERWGDIKSISDESEKWLASLKRKEKVHAILSRIAYEIYFERRTWVNYETLLFYAVYFSHTVLVRGISELGIFIGKEAARNTSPVILAASNLYTSSIFHYMDGDEVKHNRLNYLLHKREYIAEALMLLERNKAQYIVNLKNNPSTQARLTSAFKNALLLLQGLDIEVNEIENPVIELCQDEAEAEIVRPRIGADEIAKIKLKLDKLKGYRADAAKVIKIIAELLPRDALVNREMMGLNPFCVTLINECIEAKRQPGCFSAVSMVSSTVEHNDDDDNEPIRDYTKSAHARLMPPEMPSGYYNLGGAMPRIEDEERMAEYQRLRKEFAISLYNNFLRALDCNFFQTLLRLQGANLYDLIGQLLSYRNELSELLQKISLKKLSAIDTSFLNNLEPWVPLNKSEINRLDQANALDIVILRIVRIAVEVKRDCLKSYPETPLSDEQRLIYLELKAALIALFGSSGLPEPTYDRSAEISYKALHNALYNLPDDDNFSGKFAIGNVGQSPELLLMWRPSFKYNSVKSKALTNIKSIVEQNALEMIFQESMFSGLFATWKAKMSVPDIVKWVSSTAVALDKEFCTMIADIVFDIEELVKYMSPESTQETEKMHRRFVDVLKEFSIKVPIPSTAFSR